jgi:hypothetical protein
MRHEETGLKTGVKKISKNGKQWKSNGRNYDIWKVSDFAE